MDVGGRSRVLRAMRAWAGLEQSIAAGRMGLGVATLRRAEIAEACSDKTWETALGYYASIGMHWRAGDHLVPSMLILKD